mmetsp:Transcript_19494/g.23228  ORF Transcript_19494/g.23228 Transcript_19494/m.23228 type:complete len:99 (+) Transcript_19494:177-473(+)
MGTLTFQENKNTHTRCIHESARNASAAKHANIYKFLKSEMDTKHTWGVRKRERKRKTSMDHFWLEGKKALCLTNIHTGRDGELLVLKHVIIVTLLFYK